MNKSIGIFSVICISFFNTSIGQTMATTTAVSSDLTNTPMYAVRDYSDGFYVTLEDFINKKKTKLNPVERRAIVGFEKKLIPKDVIVDHIFLYTVADQMKLTGVFAVSLEGNLYIQQKNFRKYAVKGDKSEEGDNPNSYHRVLQAGKFLYLEAELANAWSKGFAYGTGGAVGGALGSSMNRLKGIAFDVVKKEFNVLKDCKDFNEFLTIYQAENVECKNKKIDIVTVRENINKIIK
ncbi:hypothetical protein SAMN05444395_107114 [Flavobacterium fryxellicola]|nr:hypothetical protein [Flavobacterium fryxellicola]SHN72776.1 hypothetical protein SAMN05444395_107114 [Flavobacterium fryxellicola]